MNTSLPFVALDLSAVHPLAGGGHTYAHLLTRHLPEVGIQPLCITRRGSDASEWDGAEILAIAPRPRPLRLAWEQLRLLRTLHDLPAAQGISVLHSIHYTMPERPRLVDGLARVVTIHDLTFFSRPADHSRSKRLLFQRAIEVAARRADQLICVSEATARELLATIKVTVPIEVIPHGVDRLRFAALEPVIGHDDRVLAELGIAGPYVLHLGTIEPRKNVARLVEAMDIVRQRRPGVALVLAGGAWSGVRESLPKPPGLTVHHLGVVRDGQVPALLRQAQAVAYPSLAEGYGLPVIEALSCGAPVVTSAGSVMQELAGDSAMYADPTDVADLARVIDDALAGNGPSLALRLATAARFDARTSALRHGELYRRFA